MAKRRKTALQKNRDRLNRQIRKAERRGYRFEAAFKEKIKTASVQQLSHWRGDYIYRYGERDFVNPKTGEIETVRGLDARRRERLEASKRGGRELWRKQHPEPAMAEPEQEEALRDEEEEERRREEEAQQRKEEERSAEEARANIIINNIKEVLRQPSNQSRSKRVSEESDYLSADLIKRIDEESSTFDGKIALADRIRKNMDALEVQIDRMKWDSEQDSVTNAYNGVLEIISDTVGFSINDDFFQVLEDSMW